MRRKGERDIPDFSPKHKAAPHGVTPEPKLSKAQHPARVPAVKPYATSAKSGRRGQ
jgi:hypothetical protein